MNSNQVDIRIGGLLKLIRDEKLKADVLLCPGDIGDKADPAGIEYGWKALHRVAEALKVLPGRGHYGKSYSFSLDSSQIRSGPKF